MLRALLRPSRSCTSFSPGSFHSSTFTTPRLLPSFRHFGAAPILPASTRTIMTDQPPTPAPPAESVPLDANGQPLSKNALKKLQKDAEKAARKAELKAASAASQQSKQAEADVDDATENYGKAPLNKSGKREGRTYVNLSDLSEARAGETVWLQARVHNTRAQSAKLCFVVFRSGLSTIQALLSVAPTKVSKQMVKFANRIPLESIVLVQGVLQKPVEPIKTCTVQDVEVKVEKLFVISEAMDRLPFALEDASRGEKEVEAAGEDAQFVTVNFDTRLDNRVLDLRTPANQAIFRVQSAICQEFRSFLLSQKFLEIHSPKLQSAATESGASVFKVEYFEGKAFLAQSPQLGKQMAIAADFGKVFEIGPVFRAENSNTARHMTEFTGLDLEMSLQEHYHEAVELLDSLFLHIFRALQSSYSKEIEIVKLQHPHDDFKFLETTLRLTHRDAVDLLIQKGFEIQQGEDMSTPMEKALGEIIREKYNTDYYIIDKFPLAIRPFYTMPDAEDPTLSNSYDFFMRGEEIISGAQRIHEPALLIERMKAAQINPNDMKGYLSAFEMGCPPHAGGGIGLERVVMLFLKLGNIRRASLFPRDPKRLDP